MLSNTIFQELPSNIPKPLQPQGIASHHTPKHAIQHAGQTGHRLPSFWTKFPHKRLGTPNISHRILRISHRFLRIAGQNHSIWTKSGQNKNTLSCEILKQNARVSTL